MTFLFLMYRFLISVYQLGFISETTGRTNKDTIKVNKSTLPMSTVTPTMGIQTQKNIESSEISIETSPSLTLKKDK